MNETETRAQLELFKKTLEYYADPANYVNGQIEKDRGFLAKHTLSLIDDTKKQLDAAQEIFLKAYANETAILSSEELPIETLDKLKAIQDLLDKHK